MCAWLFTTSMVQVLHYMVQVLVLHYYTYKDHCLRCHPTYVYVNINVQHNCYKFSTEIYSEIKSGILGRYTIHADHHISHLMITK